MNRRARIFLLCITIFSLLSILPAFSPDPEGPVNIPLGPAPLWSKINKVCIWDLEYLDGETWRSRKELLEIGRAYPENNTCKITLNFTSDGAGSYRLTLAIKEKVLDHINKTGSFQYELTFMNYSLIFDWSDLKNIPGLKFKHGLQDHYFYFRIKKENVPASKSFSLDPSLIVYTGAYWSLCYENQYKTFRNPGGLRYHYSLIYRNPGNTLNFYRSNQGASWNLEAVIKSGIATNIYHSSSLWTYHNGSGLLVYFVWCEKELGNEGIYYRRGFIADNNFTIALEAEQTVVDNAGIYSYVVISLAENGYLSIVAQRRDGGAWSLYIEAYNEIVCDWTKVGTPPYIRGYSPNYIYTSSKNDEIEEWTFDNMTRPDNPDRVNLTINAKCDDGNDYLDAYLYDGSSWNGPFSYYPTTSYTTLTQDVTSALDTHTKLNNAKLKFVKRSVGGSNDLYVLHTHLRVETDISYEIISYGSTVPYNPTALNWSSENLVFGASGIPTLIGLNGSSSDFMYAWRNSLNVSLRPANFSGSSFSFSSIINSTIPTVDYRTVIRIAEDSENSIHILANSNSTPYYINYSSGAGFGAWQVVKNQTISSASLGIDLTASPNQIVIFYNTFNAILYKNQTAGNVDFPNGQEYSIAENSWAFYMCSSYRDQGRQIQLIYTRQNNVYWLNVISSYEPAGLGYGPGLIFFLFVFIVSSAVFVKKHLKF